MYKQFLERTAIVLALLGLSAMGCKSRPIGTIDPEEHRADGSPAVEEPDAGPPPPPQGELTVIKVTLIPQAGVSGNQVVNFAVPMAPGVIMSATHAEVSANTGTLPAFRRGLAPYSDGSFRSVQLQVEIDTDNINELTVTLGAAATGGDRAETDIQTTLQSPTGESGPKVWVMLPPEWLSTSKLAGASLPHSAFKGSDLDAWGNVCRYDPWDTDAFLDVNDERGPWLYDRVTAMVRGYQVYGGLSPLSSAFREAHIYRNGLSGSGPNTRIGIPNASSDVKYHYTQGLALHYLLTGDDRFRESAEDVADRMASLWTSPGYEGGADFWTERHAGFGLLAYVWAATVSDDRSEEFLTLADAAVIAYQDVQETYPAGYDDDIARCFAHSAESHGEDYGYIGCSPWMSAIIGDALDAYATVRGGPQADSARASVIKLGRAFARDGIAPTGKPYYWMGVGTSQNETDPYNEHWGEPAYLIALAYHLDGKKDTTLASAARALLEGLAESGSAPHTRSFNWQCRSAVLAPYYLSD